MGVVYLATQTFPERKVALKVLAGDLAADPVFRERFVRESNAAASTEHPNIVPVYAAGESDGVLVTDKLAASSVCCTHGPSRSSRSSRRSRCRATSPRSRAVPKGCGCSTRSTVRSPSSTWTGLEPAARGTSAEARRILELALGSLWVAKEDGTLLRVDPLTGQTLEIESGTPPAAVSGPEDPFEPVWVYAVELTDL